jgi:chromosome segregation ATPase
MDTKNIVIITLIILLLGITALYFFSSSGYKKDINRLEKDSKTIQHERDSLDKANKKILEEVNIHLKNIELLQVRIDSVETLIVNKNKEISKLKYNANEYRKENERIKREIEKLENNPIKRVGDDLLNSLKEKTK